MNKRIDFLSHLTNFDTFGQLVPSFNLNGRQKIKSWVGAIVSIMMFTVVILFSIIKFQHLIERKNTLITMNGAELDSSVTYSLN